MRILMLHNDYQQAGGETFSVATETQALRNLGHDVEYIMVSNDELKNVGKVKSARRAISSRTSFELVSASLDAFEPDIVHAQNLFPLLGAGAIDAFRSRGVPWVRSLRNFRKRCLSANLFRDESICTKCSSAAKAVEGVRNGCYRGSRAQSAIAMVYGRNEQIAENRHPPGAYIVVSEAVSLGLSDALNTSVPIVVKPNAVESMTRIKNDRQGVLFVGRLEAHKGVELVIAMAQQMADTTFTIVGEGPLESTVDSAVGIAKNINWHRRVDNSDVLDLMSRSRIVAAPSRWIEPFGRVAVEAMSAGAVPLVGDKGGLVEIAGSISPEYVLQTTSVSEWVFAARKILAMPDSEFESLSETCLNLYRENYTAKRNGQLLEDIYRTVLSNNVG